MANDDRDSATTALGLARYARDYYRGAVAVDDVLGGEPQWLVVAPAPAMHLAAHAIELVLKAYLRQRGYSVKEVVAFGHRLLETWQACCDNGIEDFVCLSKNDREVLVVIARLHASHDLRYIRTGANVYPVFGSLQELVEKLLTAVLPLVGWKRPVLD
jgi:hypothetical protein